MAVGVGDRHRLTAALPRSKRAGANKVQGNVTDQGHITPQPPVYIKSRQRLAACQKCSPLLLVHSSTCTVARRGERWPYGYRAAS